MFHILGFLFIIVIAVLIIGLTIVGSVLRAIFGLGGRRNTSSTHTYSGNHKHYHASDMDNDDDEEVITEKGTNRHKKIFSDEEGEYVDFEEITK
ncbi:DUF4834 family protein [Bacteroides sp.]